MVTSGATPSETPARTPDATPAPPVLARYGSENTYYEHFVAALARGELAIQQCDACSYLRWPPTRACTECLSPQWHWQDVDGRGEIWSVAVYEHAYGSHRQVPYNVVMVRLDCGVTMVSTVVGTDDLSLAPGWRVVADLDGPGPGLARLVFRLDEAVAR
jgi:uncharacterized OB-fold protein